MIHVCMTRLPIKRRGASPKSVCWDKSPLRVSLRGGSPYLLDQVFAVMQEWSAYCAMRFEHTLDPVQADIRVNLAGDGVSWSYVGTEGRMIVPPDETLHLGWLDDDTPENELRRVVLHETGHVLGLIHEHQSPGSGIHWNREAVVRYYRAQGWSRAMVEQNIFRTYSHDQTNFTRFDPTSIMEYPIPAELTLDGYSVGWNNELSAMDKQFIRELYP